MNPAQRTAMGPVAVDLYGYGQVGRALIERLGAEGITLASIHDGRGLRAELKVAPARRVMVDATAPRYAGDPAEAWIGRLETALASGTSVVTCNKAPLAVAWDRLVRAAEHGGATLACSATVGGGTPLLRFLGGLHASDGLVRVEACLSGTLSFVLHRIAQGDDLDAAVQQAQRAGYAEPDPALDLDGTDAYAKALIVHNRLFGAAGAWSLSERAETFSLRVSDVRTILEAGAVPQAVATVEAGSVRLALEARTPRNALVELPGTASVAATTRDGRVFRLAGPGAGPAVTAGALVGDLSTLADGSAAVGVWP